MSQPLISMIVLGFRNFDVTTKACLQSLLPAMGDPEVEYLILDNGSDDDSAEKTRQWAVANGAPTPLISSTNRGFAGGMNWGAEHAHGEWLILVNNDTIFPSNALPAFKRVLRSLPEKVAMLGPATNAAGNGQRLWKPGADFSEWLDIGTQLNDQPTGMLLPVYRCDFFCIAIRKSAWTQLHGLDTDFGLGYYEDFDFSLRLRAAGWDQVISDDIFVLHTGSATFKASASAKALMKRNKNLLKKKHADVSFEHTRLGNLSVLKAYWQRKQNKDWSPSLETRWKLRVDALSGDAPRSLFKKWLWKKRVSRIFLS